MNKKYTVLIILILVVGGLFLFINRNKAEAPVLNSNQAGKMQAVAIPADYNIPVSKTSAPVKEFTVTGKNFSFDPATLGVKKGDVVKITFKNSEGFHNFRIDEFKVSTSLIKTGEEGSVEFVADKVGSFEYYCSVGTHRAMGMWGTLTVN